MINVMRPCTSIHLFVDDFHLLFQLLFFFFFRHLIWARKSRNDASPTPVCKNANQLDCQPLKKMPSRKSYPPTSAKPKHVIDTQLAQVGNRRHTTTTNGRADLDFSVASGGYSLSLYLPRSSSPNECVRVCV